ncbi:MAG: ligase [Bacteroidota bacterium]|nr:ligase [Bacteroidota bacterium]
MNYMDYIKPMFATSGGKPFSSGDWIFELKLDGFRAIAELNKGKEKLYSRNGLDFSKDYPAVFSALKKLNLKAILDGEIVALDKNNSPSFQLLQQTMIDPSIQLAYYVFDILQLNGKDLTRLPLIERKEILKKSLQPNEVIRYSDHIEKEGKKFFELVIKKNIEGMMAKKKDSLYMPGRRSADWLKVKHHHEQEAIIIGFTEPKGGRKHFGSLLLAVYHNGELKYVGNAGTGFNDQGLKDVFDKMKPLTVDRSPVKEKIPATGDVTWIKPKLVSNIKFTEWTNGGQMRHPVFLGLRKDKSAREVIKERE